MPALGTLLGVSDPTPPYRIEVDELTIRCYQPSDAEALRDAMAASKEHLLPWMQWAADEPQSLDEKLDLIRKFRGQLDLGGDAVYGIFVGDELVGGIGIHQRVGPGAGELGYWVHVDHVRRGIATRSAAAATRIGFELLEFARMEIHTEPDNVASAAIPARLGYELEATLRRRPISEFSPQPRDLQIWTMFDDRFPSSPMADIDVQAFDALDRPIL